MTPAKRTGRPEVGPNINIRMPRELVEWIDRQAARAGQRRPEWVRDRLEELRQESLQDELAARRRGKGAEYLSPAAIKAAHALMLDRGSAELWFDDAADAAQWRSLMRQEMRRTDRVTVHTHARTADTGPNAGRTIAIAYLPDFTPSDEQMREVGRKLNAFFERQEREDETDG